MKGRKSKQCCCAVSADCPTCVDAACTWTAVDGTVTYSAGEYTGAEGAKAYVDRAAAWIPASLSHTTVTCTVRLNDGDGVRIIGNIDIDGASFVYSWIGLSKSDTGKVYMSTGRLNDVPIDRYDGGLRVDEDDWKSIGCDHSELLGCVDGEIEVYVEACFTPTGEVFGYAPLFDANIYNQTDDTAASHPQAVGLAFENGSGAVSNFTAIAAKDGAACKFCNKLPKPDTCMYCLPGSVPAYIDVELPAINTVGPTCSPPCELFGSRTVRIFRDDDGVYGKCAYTVSANGMCFNEVPAVPGIPAHDSTNLVLSLAHIAEDTGSYLEFTIGGGTSNYMTWQTDSEVPNGPVRLIDDIPVGEAGIYFDDYNRYDCSCYINDLHWALRVNNWYFASTRCEATGPIITTCDVRAIP